MVDTSMSTLGELAFIQEAAAHFVRQVVRHGDRLAVFEFDSTVTQLSHFSSDVRTLQAAIRAAQPGAGTSLYDAVYLGADALRGRPPGRRRVLVLITDAGETTSDASFEEARRAGLRSEALLYTILVRPVRSESGRNTAGEHALLTITDVTGGVMYTPDSSAELGETFDRIDRELRTQYRLGYYPEPRPPAHSQRRIEVRVLPEKVAAASGSASKTAPTPAGFVIRHRKGYLTGPFE
jgi:Ca-activated chloride channel family protein